MALTRHTSSPEEAERTPQAFRPRPHSRSWSIASRIRSKAMRYGLPILTTAAIAAARTLVAPMLGHQAPLLAFTLAVMISAYEGGLGPGLLATVLGAVAGGYFFMEPELGLHPIAVADHVHLVFFVVVGILISMLSHAMRQARNRAAADAAALAAGEDRLRASVQELARSNAELDQFASIISHDLRSPMMTISGYAHMLTAQAGPELPAESRESLDSIRGSIRQMDNLITTLLAYSRVGRARLNVTRCNTQTVLDGVLSTLEQQLSDAGARVTRDPLPTVRADEVLLAQLLQNLIENAIKYCGAGRPEIHVRAHREADEWVFSVRDNGIGIDAEHYERVFEMGHRLHPDESRYPGSGIGLATCKKIVERHGGRIWVDSQPGKGSTFHFTLPA